MKPALLLALCVALAGCTTVDQTVRGYDEARAEWRVAGAWLLVAGEQPGLNSAKVKLRGFSKDQTAWGWQLVVEAEGRDGWPGLETLRLLPSGVTATAVPLDGRVRSYGGRSGTAIALQPVEQVAFWLPADALKEASVQGLELAIAGHRASIHLRLPADYVAEVLVLAR